MIAERFLLAIVALAILGFGAAFHPSLRRAGLAARAAAAFGLGAVLLTLGGMLLTAARVPWSVPALAAFPLAVSAAAAFFWSRRPPESFPPVDAGRSARLVSLSVGGAAFALLAWALLSGRATSMDYLYFWGVKAARFAEVRGIDVPLLGYRFFSHGVPDYPPLVPVVQSFGALAEGRLPWRHVPLTSLLWVAAAVPLIRVFIRRRLDGDAAAAVTTFWAAALCASAAKSLSGGNAEAPLLFFETAAIAALLTEGRSSSRFLPALMLSGAVLTKVEGTVAAILIVAGAAARDAIERRPNLFRGTAALALPPAAAVAAWFAFQQHFGLRPGFRSHGGLLALHWDHVGTILGRLPLALEAGTFGLAWALPIVVLFASRPTRAVLARCLPAIALTGGLLAFLVFEYMHDRENPGVRIIWTAPRVSQPALSALILAAGLASLDPERRRRRSTARETPSDTALTAAP